MADYIGMSAQLAGNALRVSWYSAVNWLMSRESRRLGVVSRYKPVRPVPADEELFGELRRLLVRDAALVRDGILPAAEDEPMGLRDHLARLRAMLADLPATLERRENAVTVSARTLGDPTGLPEYFTQDFHFQTGGYLSADSARLYDVQVETLFMGSAGPMRRACLRPVLDALRGRDQRKLALLDVACGTGRFLRQVRLACPALRLTGLDLSEAYLREAAAGFEGLRSATWLKGNAEAMPLSDASQDVVTSIFLFHELPPDARRNVAREFARVLKPGGTLVFMDSLQMGDKPDWDGLLEAFPVRFHEPYYRHYAIDDLDGLFRGVGLVPVETRAVFLSKMIVCRKG